jgi:uroporphyrin-3 C-methyltransferase
MSDKQDDIQTTEDAELVLEESTTDDATADITADIAADIAEEKTARGNGVAWLAVLLSIAALGAVGYLLFINWYATDDNAAAETLARMEALDQRLNETNSNLAALESQSGPVTHPDFGADIAAVRRDLEEQLRLQSSLPSRMTSIENSVAALAGISAGARETFLLAEAEYYLQIANAQLQLASNPHLAALALGMADERVTQISDPGLTAVRSAIADEITALELMKKPDIEGATLTLGSLARVAEYLPLAGTKPTEAEQEEQDAEQSNIDRAWGSVKDAMSGLVKVTPPDQAQRALIAPDAEYFLRNNIALQLQSARLALLRGEQTIFEQTLDDTSALLNTYFDVDSEQVISAQQTISEIRNDVFTTSMPDISASLRMLRQFRTLRETDE